MMETFKRIPLSEGEHLELSLEDSAGQSYTCDVEIRRLLSRGQGTTCLVYEGEIRQTKGPAKRVILKEFYPVPKNEIFDIRRQDGALAVSPLTKEGAEYQKRLQQFRQGYDMQVRLSNSDAMEVMVKPLGFAAYGDSFYIISDIHRGESLCLEKFRTLEEKIGMLLRVVETLDILHRQGYLFLDFCPENLLWIPDTRTVRLFDADSLVNYRSLDQVQPSEVYYRPCYSSPQIRMLFDPTGFSELEFAQKKDVYLNEKADIFSAGVLLFQCLLGRFPEEEELSFEEECRETLMDELRRCCRLKEKQAAKLLQVLEKTLHRDTMYRYRNTTALQKELEKFWHEISAKSYLPRRDAAEANYSFVSYNVLEQHPVYRFAKTEKGVRRLDVTLVGTHALRTPMLRAVISCAQMLDSKLTIRIFDENALEFWKDFTSEEKNEDLRRAVSCHMGPTVIHAAIDNTLVDSALADVCLYETVSPDDVATLIDRRGAGYVLALCEDFEQNRAIAKKLIGVSRKGMPLFVGYLDRNEEKLRIPASVQHPRAKKPSIVCQQITAWKQDGQYDERMFRSRIYNMGLKVHIFYARGTAPRASRTEMEEAFRSDPYYMESSERSALHALYKLASLNRPGQEPVLDPEAANAPMEFYRRVLSDKTKEARQLFDELVHLEHRSWTAFMLTHGHRSVSSDQIKDYAYFKNNDWKDVSDPEHYLHPCLAASRPGKGLVNVDWTQATLDVKKLDYLDRASLEIHRIASRIAEERRGEIDEILDDLEKAFADSDCLNTKEALAWLRVSADKCYQRESSVQEIWKKALRMFEEACEAESCGDTRVKDRTALEWAAWLDRKIKPAIEAGRYRDFKDSDEDIVRALPEILETGRQYGPSEKKVGKEKRSVFRRMLVKPVSPLAWQNVYSSLLIEPDCLVLLTDHPETVDVKFYRKFFDDRGMEQMEIRIEKEPGRYGQTVYVDLTGADPIMIYQVLQAKHLQSAALFTVADRRIRGLNQTRTEIFNRPIELSVSETLYLTRAVDTSVRKENPITGLTNGQYTVLWDTYQECNGFYWRCFIKALEQIENRKVVKVPLKQPGKVQQVQIGHLPAALLTLTGYERLLEKCEKYGLITDLDFPKKQDDYPVTFRTAYSEIALVMQNFAKLAKAEPFKLCLDVEEMDGGWLQFSNQTLYVDADIPHELMGKKEKSEGEKEEKEGEKEGDKTYQDDAVKRVLERIRQKSQNQILQNIEYRDNPDGGIHISFRYASEAVREVLRKEGSILEAVIYFDCIRNNVFDDIRINSEFNWGASKVCNEVDIIGVKNGKTYFISAKMTEPNKSHLEEIESLCRRFSIDGQPVLVTSKRRYRNEEPRAVELRSALMNVIYVPADMITVSECGKRRIIVGNTLLEKVRETCGTV